MKMLIASGLLMVGMALSAVAQGEEASSCEAKKKKWKFDGSTGGGFSYDSNPFRFSQTQRSRRDSKRSSDRISGRYRDMDSNDDFIFSPFAKVKGRGPSPFGRKLGFHVRTGFHKFFENEEKDYFELGVGLWQDIGRDGQLNLDFDYIPEFFHKNFLAEATDKTGRVSKKERVYRKGEYGLWALALEYQHEFLSTKGKSKFGFEGRVRVGYRERDYDRSAFADRDRASWFMGPTFVFKFQHVADVSLGYQFELSDSDSRSTVLILDEPVFGVDFNGDGDATDENLRAVRRVDRSFDAHRLKLKVTFDLGDHCELNLLGQRQWRDYRSHHTFDIGNRGREDVTDKIGTGLRIPLFKDWEGEVSYAWSKRRSVRSSLVPDSHVRKYERHQAFIGVVYRF